MQMAGRGVQSRLTLTPTQDSSISLIAFANVHSNWGRGWMRRINPFNFDIPKIYQHSSAHGMGSKLGAILRLNQDTADELSLPACRGRHQKSCLITISLSKITVGSNGWSG
jgi:hypothetical protein